MPWWLRDSQDEHPLEHDAPANPASAPADDSVDPDPDRDRDGDEGRSEDPPRSRRRRRRSSRRRSRQAAGGDAAEPAVADEAVSEAQAEGDVDREAPAAKARGDEESDHRLPRRRRRRRRSGRDTERRDGAESRDSDTETRPDSDTIQEPDDREPPRRGQRRARRPQEQRQQQARAARQSVSPQARKDRRPKEPDTASQRPDRIVAVPEEHLPNDIVYAVPESRMTLADERRIAMFVDLENIALGVRDSDIRAFEVNLILERLLEKGKIIAKRAYADWERYSEFKRAFHLAAIELIDIPQKRYSGKNSADIKMVVDAMDLCYSKEHVDTFVLVSGDSDFSPLVSKLKENDKYVIGIGVKNSSSDLLIDNCDEFIYYEDVWRDAVSSPRLDDMPSSEHAEAFKLMTDAILALNRENKDVIWGSMVKQTMKRKKPSFNEGYHGYSTFSELLEDAEAKGLIKLSRDQRSGNYIIKEFAAAKARHADDDGEEGSKSDGRSRSGRGSSGRGSDGRSSTGRSRSRGGRRGGRSRSR